MKNKKLLLSLLALTVLASCGNTIGGLKKGDDILNGKVIENNFEKGEEEVEVNNLVQSNIGEVQFDSEEVLRHYSAGVLVTINEQGYVGFYSLLHQKQIVANQFESKWLNYSVQDDNNVGYFISVIYEGTQTFYDSFGNVVYSGDEQEDVDIVTAVYNDSVYLTIEKYIDNNSRPEYSYFKYNEDGTIKKIDNISDDVLANLPNNQEENKFPFGSQYNEMFSLEEFGLKGYVSMADQIMTLYNEDKEMIKTFIMPENTTGAAVITDKIYYQVISEVPEDSKEYDLYVQASGSISKGLKYNIDTYSINLENGKEKEEDLEFIILDSRPYKGETEEETYSIMTMQLINKDKTLGEIVSYLIDSKGVLHDQVNGLYIDDFIKVGENFLNEETGILYDAEFKQIAFLADIDPEYDEKSGYILGKLDGKYGILDSNAKVVLEFEADEIVSEIVDNKVISLRDSVYYRHDLISGNEEILGINFVSIDNGAYITYDNEFYYFHSASEVLHKLPLDNLISFNYQTYHYTLNNASYILIDYSYKTTVEEFDENLQDYVEKDVYTNHYVTLDINKLPNADSLTTIGVENKTEINYPDTVENAISLELGEGFVHGYQQGRTYMEYTPSVAGYYTFTMDEECYFYAINSSGSYVSSQTEINNETGLAETTYKLDAGETYLFAVSGDYYPMGLSKYEYTFELELGDDDAYPLIFADNNKEVLTDKFGEAYVEFTPEYDGEYLVNLEDGYIVIDNETYYSTDTLYVEKGQKLEVKYYSSNTDSAKKKIDFVCGSTNQEDGKSLFTAVEISSDPENPTAINHSNEYGNYYKYVNESTKEQAVILSANSTSYYSSNYTLYNNELEEIESGSLYYDGKLFTLVKPNETVYLELETGDTATTILANLTPVSDETVNENTQYEVSENKLFKLSTSSYDKLVSLSYLSPLSTNVILFNSDGEFVEYINGSSGTTDAIILDGSETLYVYVEGVEGNTISFDITEVPVSSLYISDANDYLSTNILNSDNYQWYQFTNNSTETELVKFTVANDQTVSNAYLSIYQDGEINGRHNLYYYDEYFFTYEVRPGESIYILIENENTYSYTFYYTIKAEIAV